MSRRYLIIASIAAHAALGVGIFISGIWKLERLDPQRRASLALGAMMPPGDEGGGEGEKAEKKAEKKKEKEKKDQKKVVKEPRQVEKIDKDKPVEVALDTTGGGGGEGEGEGSGVGPATGGGGGGTCDPLADPNQCMGPPNVPTVATCGDGIKVAPEQCDDGNLTDGDKCSSTCKNEQVLLPPNIFAGMRISGETQIVPPDPVKTEMLRDGKERTTGSFKLCIDTGGRVASTTPIAGGTKYPAYDAKITTAMRVWRYKPYTVNNQGMVSAVPACSVVTFVYTIK